MTPFILACPTLINFRKSLICDNATIPWQIYRCGLLQDIPYDIAQQLNKLYGINYNFDLRSKEEIVESDYNDKLQQIGIKRITFPLNSGKSSFRLLKHPTYLDYTKYYIELLENNKIVIKEIFTQLNLIDKGSILLNCQLGKDRTGIICLLLALSANLTDELLINDFLLSGKHLQHEIDKLETKWKQKNLHKSDYLKRITPDVRTVKETLAYLVGKYGSYPNYFQSLCFI